MTEQEKAEHHSHGVLIDGLIQTVNDLKAELKQATNRINNLLLLIPALEEAGIVRRAEDGTFKPVPVKPEAITRPPAKKKRTNKKVAAKPGKKTAKKK